MILEEMLHASAKRVEEEYTSMMRRRACCAAGVMLQFTIQRTLYLSFRKRHLLLRKQLDFLTNDVNTSRRARKRASYRSSDAFSSITAFLYASPSIAFAKHMILVVFPVPGGPYHGNGRSKPTARRMWGRFPFFAITCRRSMESSLPTISDNYSDERPPLFTTSWGLYFSIHGCSIRVRRI